MGPAWTLAAVLLLASCASGGTGGWVPLTPASDASGPVIRIAGTVRHLEVEGGLFVIRDTQGRQFSPTNLPEQFKVDGFLVEVDARERKDMVSIGMVGTLIELVQIRRSPTGGEP